MSYEDETKIAYRDKTKAEGYKEQYTKGFKWARFTMWRVQCQLKRALQTCGLNPFNLILDIPCGTGVSAITLRSFCSGSVAADISLEMIDLAEEYMNNDNCIGFVNADIITVPFKKQTFDCIVLLGLMHRVPSNIRQQVLREMASKTKKFLIVSYAVDNFSQRLKQRLMRQIWPTHKPALCPCSISDIEKEIESNNLIIRRAFSVMRFMSAQKILLLETLGDRNTARKN